MEWFKNLKVGARLIASFAVMIIFMAVIGMVGYRSIDVIYRHLEGIFAVNLPGMDYLIEADRDLQQLLVAERSMVFANTQSAEFKGLVDEYETNLKQADERWEKYKALAASPEEKALIPKFEKAREEWKVISRRVVDGRLADTREGRREALDLTLGVARQKFEEMRDYLDQLTGLNLKAAENAHEKSSATYRSTVILLLAAIGAGLLAAVLLVWALSRGVTGPLKKMIEGLSSAAGQINAGSAQLAAGSQSLAEGASEQAASIEETSASIEELSSMTRANAGNADAAKSMMVSTSEIVGKVNRHMDEMAAAIAEINKSSEETGKIIKTIDEIAFQTNLLALNAAVEAARAGAAGAGFAVVADEVRNLAMRAAEAAKNTSRLIADTIRAVQNGNKLTLLTQEAVAENVDIAQKVGDLVAEIASASSEQAQGIEQLNKAISEMDSVVQRVAANAEETASTAEEMNAQSEQLQTMVGDLTALVGHAAEGKGSRRMVKGREPHLTKEPVRGRPALAAPVRKQVRGDKAGKAKERKPEQIIPLDDEDFKDF
ncbi:MAG: methyl-accepting chemotaxis protein [Desulfobulbaceae bacterium]|nr:methyl-accepting chemotaxis protein [Desulfobulbaceae bacterium]